MKSLVINFFGEACTGKSTHASGFYSHLKREGVSCELVREWVKDVFYDEKPRIPNQMLITGTQIDMIERLDGKVKVIITDSPILLGAIYASHFNKLFLSLQIEQEFKRFNNFNILLKRDFNFIPEGRGTGKTASEIEKKISQREGIFDVSMPSSKVNYKALFEQIKGLIPIEDRPIREHSKS